MTVARDQAGRRLGWSVAQFMVGHGVSLRQQSVTHDGLTWKTGRASEDGWQSGGDAAGVTKVRISMG